MASCDSQGCRSAYPEVRSFSTGSSTISRYYYLTDHLGSVRATVNETGGARLLGLEQLVDVKVDATRVEQPGLDLRIRFENALVLHVFCDQTNLVDQYDNYSLFSPGSVLTVGTRSILFEEEKALPFFSCLGRGGRA